MFEVFFEHPAEFGEKQGSEADVGADETEKLGDGFEKFYGGFQELFHLLSSDLFDFKIPDIAASGST